MTETEKQTTRDTAMQMRRLAIKAICQGEHEVAEGLIAAAQDVKRWVDTDEEKAS